MKCHTTNKMAPINDSITSFTLSIGVLLWMEALPFAALCDECCIIVYIICSSSHTYVMCSRVCSHGNTEKCTETHGVMLCKQNCHVSHTRIHIPGESTEFNSFSAFFIMLCNDSGNTAQKNGDRGKRTNDPGPTLFCGASAMSHWSQPWILCPPLPSVLVAGVPLSSDRLGPILRLEAGTVWMWW